jgi:hypothetical protein
LHFVAQPSGATGGPGITREYRSER